MLNNVTLVGRLTKDVEVRKTKDEKSISTITLAVNVGKDEVNFFDCVILGDKVDNLAKYCKKGALIGVTGSLHQRKYTRKDGSQNSVIEILVNNIEYLSSKEKEAEAPNPDEFAVEEEKIPDGYVKGEDGKLYKVEKAK